MSIVAQQPATSVLPAGIWTIDPAHSSVEFLVQHLGLATVRGRAPFVAGTLTGGDSPILQGVVDATALTTFEEARDGHLQSPDFFDTARFPEIRFASTSVARAGDELVVQGDLTIKGVTRSVELTGTYLGSAVDAYGNDRVAVELSGTIDRTEFGLTWNAPLPGGGFLLPDTVRLAASLSAIKSSE